MSVLSRELLKWLQSLDLTYAIKNVKRDFSNGYMIAEILSRYYPSDVSMHSYDNGSALKRKMGNWDLLRKLIAKYGVPIEEEHIEGLIHCVDGVAVTVIENLYEFLTEKTLQRTVRPPPVSAESGRGKQPAYMRPTATNILKTQTDIVVDAEAQHMQAEAALEALRADQRAQRENEPTYHKQARSRGSATRDNNGGGNSYGGASETMAIKMIDRRVGMRNSTGVSELAPPDSDGSGSGAGGSLSPRVDLDAALAREDGAQSQTMELLNAIVAGEMKGEDVYQLFDPKREPIAAFVGLLSAIPANTAGRVLNTISVNVTNNAGMYLQSEDEFTQLMTIIAAACDNPTSLAAFESAVSVGCSVGGAMVAISAPTAWALFCEVCFARFVKIMAAAANKRPHILRLILAFREPGPLAQPALLNKLQEQQSLIQSHGFVHCLSLLLKMERELNDATVATYSHHAERGLDSPSQKDRLFAVDICATLSAVWSPDAVISMLGTLHKRSEDSSWQVQTRLLELVASLLSHVPASQSAVSEVYAIVSDTLTPHSCVSVQKVGLAVLAPVLRAHPGLCGPFESVLSAAPASVRSYLLSPTAVNADRVVSEVVGINDVLINPILSTWSPLGVATALANRVASSEALTRGEVEVLLGCLSSQTDPAEYGHWVAIWNALTVLVYVGLGDDATVDVTVPLTLAFINRMPNETLATLSQTMLQCLMMISRRGSAHAQSHVNGLLSELFNRGEPFAGVVVSLLLSLEELPPDSPLKGLQVHVQGYAAASGR